MLNNGLSDIEKDFIEILYEIGCMSTYQAELILHRYMNCSEGQRYKIFRHLKREYYIDFTSDDKYVLPGHLKGDRGNSKLVKANVIALSIAMDQMLKDKEPLDSLKFIFKSQGGTISFMSNEQLYKIYVLSFDSIYKIRIVEEKYAEKSRMLNNDSKAKGLGFEEISIFVFTEERRADEILDAIEGLELTIPHRIVITKGSDISRAITYDQYDIEQEAE